MWPVSDWVTTIIAFTARAGGNHRILPKDGVIQSNLQQGRQDDGARATGVVQLQKVVFTKDGCVQRQSATMIVWWLAHSLV